MRKIWVLSFVLASGFADLTINSLFSGSQLLPKVLGHEQIANSAKDTSPDRTSSGRPNSTGYLDGTTQFLSLEANTAFTTDRARLVEETFGYKRVRQPPTDRLADSFTESGIREVDLYDGEVHELGVIAGDSGGGGIGTEFPGESQHNPLLPTETGGNQPIFRNLRRCRWDDRPTTYGFEFEGLDGTLFTEILNFPTGKDERVTVSVGDTVLGEFGPGDSVDFVSLFGKGVSNFKITDIDALPGSTLKVSYPIQLAFDRPFGNFTRTALCPPSNSVPE